MLEDYRDFRNELEHHEKQLQEEKEALEKGLAEKDQEIIQLNEARQQLSEARASLETQLEERDRELAILGEARTGLQADKEGLEAQVAQANAELAEVREAQSKLAGEKATLELELEGKSEELAKLGEEKARLETSLTDTCEALNVVREENGALAEEKLALEKQAAEGTAELEVVKTERLTLAGENELLENKLFETEKELAALHQARSKAEADLSIANTKIAELTTHIDEYAAKAEEGAKEMSLLRATMEERDAEHAVAKEDMAKLTEEVGELETRGVALESQLTAMTASAEEKAGLAESLNAQLSDLTKEMGEAVTRITTLEAALKDITEQAEERRIHIESLKGEMSHQAATAKTRVEQLETELSTLTATNTQLQQDLSTAQSNLTTTLQDLSTKTTRLSELDSLRVPLPLESEETYVSLLDTIWTRIASLIETTFRQDLSATILADESCWTNLLQSPSTRHIPLPQTNSPAAKQMRIAVILSLLSRSLHTHIFRPVYLTSTPEDPLPHILRAIALSNPAHEEHTRATLLAMLPAERQRAFGVKRVAAVVREVSYAVQHLLTALQYEAFCVGLEQVCKLACAQWMRIQLGKMRVEPYFGPPFGDFDWQVLPLPAFEGGGEEGGERDDLVVEVGRPVDDGQVVEDKLEAVTSPGPMEDGDVGPDDIMLVVWPSMCVVENGELESITQGLVISKDQVRTATDEVRGRGRQRPGAKRARTLSMPGRGVSGQAFLAQAGGPDLVDG
jgi:predicted  nucleic acid-binding Zn-ribbon protein